MAAKHILAIDQGTTSTRAHRVRRRGPAGGRGAEGVAAASSRSPAGSSTTRRRSGERRVEVCRGALAEAGLDAGDIAAIGITNQRETTVVWDRATGEPLAPRHRLAGPPHRRPLRRAAGAGPRGRCPRATGLVLDPYFSGTKIDLAARQRRGRARAAERGELAVRHDRQLPALAADRRRGHATDATNASRTLLFDIRDGALGPGAAATLLGVPRAVLPEVRRLRRRLRRHRRADLFGARDADRRHRRRPAGGDRRPGLLRAGHAARHLRHRLLRCSTPAATPVRSRNRLLDDHRLAARRRADLRARGLDLRRRRGRAVAARRADDHPQRRARPRRWPQAADPSRTSYLVPAFTGLGAPYWDPDARGAIFGLTRGTGPRRHRPRGAGGDRLPDPRPARRHARRLAAARPTRCCASTAAWRRTTG